MMRTFMFRKHVVNPLFCFVFVPMCQSVGLVSAFLPLDIGP